MNLWKPTMNASSLPIFQPEELDFLLRVLSEPEPASPRAVRGSEYSAGNMTLSPQNRLLLRTNEPRRPKVPCTMPQCNNVQSRRGLCHFHSRRRRLCKVKGCDKQDQKRGLCAKHGGADPCSIVGCTNVARVAQRCARHR